MFRKASRPRGMRLSKAQVGALMERFSEIDKAILGELPQKERGRIAKYYSKRLRFVPLSKEDGIKRCGETAWVRKAENTTTGVLVPGIGFVPERIFISLPEERYRQLLNERTSKEPTFEIAHELVHNITNAFLQEGLEARNLYLNEGLLRRRMRELYSATMDLGAAERMAKKMVQKKPRLCAAYVAHADNEAYSDLAAARVTAKLMEGRLTRRDVREFMRNRPYPVQIAFTRMAKGGKGRKERPLDRMSRTIGRRTEEAMNALGGLSGIVPEYARVPADSGLQRLGFGGARRRAKRHR
jgi:hypothetical protein